MLSDPVSSHYLLLSPQPSTSPGETHAALVVSQASFTNVRFSAGFETIEQLRTGSAPNPWESAWAVFNYTDNTHFYYVAFKPNGWELGKADPAYPGAQRFLATGSLPTTPIGTEHTFSIQVDGNVIQVWLDDVLLTTFTDNERPYLEGKVGFYTEDATVAFDNVSGSITENFEGFATQTFSDGAMLGSAWQSVFVGYGFGAIRDDGSAPPPPDDPDPRPAPSELFDLPLSGAPTNTIVGSVFGDRLRGTWQNDSIDGRGGADRMAGRGGDDTYRVDSTGDVVVERFGEGIDTVRSTASSHTLSANVENLELVGTTAQTGIGNALNNILVSNQVGSVLRGGDGHDLLVSGRGVDVLTGGAGADTFIFMQPGAHHITDYQPGIDSIDLHHLFSTYTGANPVADGVLSLRANAQGGTDILVDADGAGGNAGVVVVALDGVAPAQVNGDDLFWF